jgi:hypothetical protein
MKTMPAGTPARYGMNAYDIYVGDLSRRVGSLTGNGLYPPLTRSGASPAGSSSAQPIGSEFFEDE